MLDGLLGRGGFTSKCKSLIKSTKSRIQVLRRREEAKLRFLKDDLAKLLANGLDINAYARTEEFLGGTCLLSCYDFIEKSCDYISNQLSIMQKQRECPEEGREAVSSLMFAAARFSDLPELRDLRDVFQERYGNSLENFVNKVFVEKLASTPPTMEKRLQILKDIAVEFSIKWDSKGFQQRMATSPSFAQEQLKKQGPSRISNSNHIIHRIDNKPDVTSNDRRDLVKAPHIINNDIEVNGFKREAAILKVDNSGISFRGRREYSDEKHGLLNEKSSSRGKKPEYVDMGPTKDLIKSPLPPPYVKPKDKAMPPPYVRPQGSSYGAPPIDDLIQKESIHARENAVPLPKPRSVRRKHSKSSASQDDDNSNIVKRTSSSRRRKEHSRKGLQILFDDEHYEKDEEEKLMDKLLLHYSKKESDYDVTKLRRKSDVAGLVSPPARSVSLPRQQTGPAEATKVYARANSFQPDNQARHVHPKLPDYDDLAARFAALRGQ